MNTSDRKVHWENVFQTNDTTRVSWHQTIPTTSLGIIEELEISKTAKIIEVGSGDSFLGDCLLEKGFSEITLLDISEKALNSVRSRLKDSAEKITFISADITEFSRPNEYQLWHDRAVFHFLTSNKEISCYIQNVSESLKSGAYLVISTFSNNGPDACSGLKVKQYSEKDLTDLFAPNFINIKCFTENHNTPSGGIQNFVFCVFQRKQHL